MFRNAPDFENILLFEDNSLKKKISRFVKLYTLQQGASIAKKN